MKMARSDEEMVDTLLELYEAEFAGKSGQRYLIEWRDLRSLYGLEKLFFSRFERLREAAAGRGLYLWDLGEGEGGRMVTIIKIATVDRWRRVPKKIIREYELPVSAGADWEGDDDE